MKYILLSVVLATSAINPVIAKDKLPVLSALEVQQIQSREFDADFSNVFASLITTLQDNGYTITTSDRSAGIITATAASKSKMTYNILWGMGSKKRTQVISAFVEPRGQDRTRLRLTIVDGEVKKNLYGGTRGDNDTANVDPAVYKNVFEKIEQVVFVRKSLDAPAPTSVAATPQVAPAPISASGATVPTQAAPNTAPAGVVRASVADVPR